jgi:hypothetical protein
MPYQIAREKSGRDRNVKKRIYLNAVSFPALLVLRCRRILRCFFNTTQASLFFVVLFVALSWIHVGDISEEGVDRSLVEVISSEFVAGRMYFVITVSVCVYVEMVEEGSFCVEDDVSGSINAEARVHGISSYTGTTC